MKTPLRSLLTALVLLLPPFAQASWKDDAVLYGVAPFFLAQGSGVKPLEALRRRLPEIKELGPNVIWMLPVTTPSEPGQGYDVVDYFRLWPELGSDSDLKRLVREAHAQGLHVILDLALNHVSAKHPFVLDVAEKGEASKYWKFFQHELTPGVPYAQYFHEKTIGKGKFVYYFWDALLNLDYSNADVREYAMQVLEHWVKVYDVDGYRLDAGWGPSTRWPDFYKEASRRVRALKPDALLLAEDKAGFPAAYREFPQQPHLKGSGFDLAYDWNAHDPAWVSKWSFQLDEKFEHTVFNEEDPVKAASDFRAAVTESEDRAPGLRTLRYLENNDTAGFTAAHSVAQAKTAARAMFALPGVPVIFSGQEVGDAHAQWNLPAFDPAVPMRAKNPAMWDFYRALVKERRESRALTSGSLELVDSAPGVVTVVRRAGGEEKRVELRFNEK